MTFGRCSLGPRGGHLPAELWVLLGPANPGRTMGTLGQTWAWASVWGSVSRSAAFVLAV